MSVPLRIAFSTLAFPDATLARFSRRPYRSPVTARGHDGLA